MQSRLHRVFTGCAFAFAAAGALTVAACGRSEEAPPPPAAVSNPVDPSTAGAITGLVTFEGSPPAEPISMDSDPHA